MKIGIIGCGLIGHKRAQSLKGAELVACADNNISRAEALSKKFGDVPVFSDAAVMLEKTALDAVIICTPHNELPRLIELFVAAGKHVLVEKPAGRFAEELKSVAEISENNKTVVRIGFNHRYHRAFRKAKEIAESGVLGDLYFIRARYGHGGRIGYNKEWRADPAISGGGELIDQGSHLIDLSRMFLGDFVKVDGFARNYFWDMPVDDNAFLTLTTGKGQTAFLQASCSEWKNLFSFELYGKHGKLDINGLGGSYGVEKLTYYKMLPEMGPPETTSWEFPMADDSWDVEFQEFLKDISTERLPSPGLKDAIENLKIINQVYKQSGYDYSA